MERVERVRLDGRIDVAHDDPVRARLVHVLAPLLAEVGPERRLGRGQVDDSRPMGLHVGGATPAGAPEPLDDRHLAERLPGLVIDHVQRGARLDLRIDPDDRRARERTSAHGRGSERHRPLGRGVRGPFGRDRPAGCVGEPPRRHRDRARQELGAEGLVLAPLPCLVADEDG
jgi:hypothetical protein